MNDSENICLVCGLCCDGTLIGFVQLGKEELPALGKILEIEEENGNGFILQPCKSYCDGCTIYNERPKKCNLFKCGLLNSVDSKQMPFQNAVGIINEVKRRKNEILIKLALLPDVFESQSFYFKMVELKTRFENNINESPLTQEQLELLADINQLDSFLSNKFDVTLS